MSDRNRSTLRLRLPGAPAEPRRPLGPPQPAPAPMGGGGRSAAYAPRGYDQGGGGGYAPSRPAPVTSGRLEPCSRAILEELAALGLADAPET